MHSTGGFEAGGDKWCGVDVRVDIVSPPSLSGLYYLIDLWYISSASSLLQIFSDVPTPGHCHPHLFGPYSQVEPPKTCLQGHGHWSMGPDGFDSWNSSRCA